MKFYHRNVFCTNAQNRRQEDIPRASPENVPF